MDVSGERKWIVLGERSNMAFSANVTGKTRVCV